MYDFGNVIRGQIGICLYRFGISLGGKSEVQLISYDNEEYDDNKPDCRKKKKFKIVFIPYILFIYFFL